MTPDPSPSGETWVCRSRNAHSRCIGPISADRPGHSRCGPVPSSDTPSDGAGCPSKDCTRGECIDCPPPTPVDGDSGRRGEAQIAATALHDAGVNTTVSASDNGLLIRVHDRYTPRLLELLAPPSVGEERRPVDGGERSQSEQWFVVHHNQIRSLRFGTFPIERLARASIAACTCGPHTLRHTVTTTYTASTTEEFVAAAADRGEG